MRKALVLIGCCLLAACGGSTPTTPSKPPTLSKARFLAFGDSLTAGEVTVPVGIIPEGPVASLLTPPSTRQIVVPTASYPTQLLSLMQARFATQASSFSISNVGKPGEYSFNGVVRFPDELTTGAPEAVLLLEGVNDLSIFGPFTPANALLEMMAEGRRRGVLVFIATMMPTKPGGRLSMNPTVLEELNALIKVRAANEKAVVVDLYNALLPEVNTVIGSDGLHPTEVGYKRMADVFLAAVQANLEVK